MLDVFRSHRTKVALAIGAFFSEYLLERFDQLSIFIDFEIESFLSQLLVVFKIVLVRKESCGFLELLLCLGDLCYAIQTLDALVGIHFERRRGWTTIDLDHWIPSLWSNNGSAQILATSSTADCFSSAIGIVGSTRRWAIN